MWLGVSLDVQQKSSQNDIVICGHLWTNQYYRDDHLVNGVCYVINSDLDPQSVKKLLPLIQLSKQAVSFPRVYNQAFGQAGTSVTFSEDGKQLLLGAPGIYTWKGSVVIYPADPENLNAVYEKPTIPDPPEGISNDSYLGYSATSGKFFDTDDVFFAVGAPRSSNLTGEVYIFKALERNTNKLVAHQQKEGTQFGEYFGASVLGVDLNGDSLTDLLVGAPFHSSHSEGDEGKVYVYQSNGLDLQPDAELQGGNQPFARFGTSIANAGDLNQDGFNDVAIGAPYEDKKGVVYIYHGSEGGIKKQYVQKIQAADIDSSLKGFGIHISRGLDIDSNDYPDILVGAYTSSKVVLFRTHPLIRLHPKLDFNPSQINTNVTDCEFEGKPLPCINVSACLRYEGKQAHLSLDFENKISLETERGFFAEEGKPKAAIIETTNLEKDVEQCIEYVLYINSNITDIVTPIQIHFRCHLAQSSNATEYFDKNYPMIDTSTSTNITNSITFHNGCVTDDKCLSNLTVKAKILGSAKSGQLTLGETSSVSLEITVINKGDPAYLSELLIRLPPDMPSINQDFCTSPSEEKNASLVCDLGNPLLENTEVKIFIKLDATEIPTDRRKLEIDLEAVTISTEIDPEDNKITIPLHLIAIANISINGRSSEEQIFYDESKGVDVSIPITHTFTIRNHGPCRLQIIDIMLYVPTTFLSSADRSMPFLTFTSLESHGGQFQQQMIPATCKDTGLNIKQIMPEENYVNDTIEPVEVVKENGTKSLHIRSTDMAGGLNDSGTVSKENLLNSHSGENYEKSSPTSHEMKDKTIVINCDKENIECVPIQCSASPFSDVTKVAQIAVTFQVNFKTLNNYLDQWNRLELITTGRISTKDKNVELQNYYSNYTEVKTVFIHKGTPEEINIWIIIGSTAVGILILIIITLVLIPSGFFKRKLKEQIKETPDAVDEQLEIEDEETSFGI